MRLEEKQALIARLEAEKAAILKNFKEKEAELFFILQQANEGLVHIEEIYDRFNPRTLIIPLSFYINLEGNLPRVLPENSRLAPYVLHNNGTRSHLDYVLFGVANNSTIQQMNPHWVAAFGDTSPWSWMTGHYAIFYKHTCSRLEEALKLVPDVYGLEIYDSVKRSVIPKFGVIGAVLTTGQIFNQTLRFNDLTMCDMFWRGEIVFKHVEISSANSTMTVKPVASVVWCESRGGSPYAYNKAISDAYIMYVATYNSYWSLVLEVREAIRVMVEYNASLNILALDVNGEPKGVYEVSDGGTISTTVTSLSKTTPWASEDERTSYSERLNSFYAYLDSAQFGLTLRRDVFLSANTKYAAAKNSLPPFMQVVIVGGNVPSRILLFLTSKA